MSLVVVHLQLGCEARMRSGLSLVFLILTVFFGLA
jgi:hypothetical protein